jgi:hypothetical protein
MNKAGDADLDLPKKAIADLALDLSRGLDCHVPFTEAEGAAVIFILALKEAGWQISRPYNSWHTACHWGRPRPDSGKEHANEQG